MTLILCLLSMLVVPAYTAFVGRIRLYKAPGMNAKSGYNSESSTYSAQAWDFAQKICGKRYLVASIVMALLAVALTVSMTSLNLVNTLLLTAIYIATEFAVNIVLMASIEVSIRKKFIPKKQEV